MNADSIQVAVIANKTPTRSGWITGVIVVQALWTLALVALVVYLLILARSQRILSGPDAADAAHGLRIGAAVIAVPAVFAIVSTLGLWKEKLWGWWIALMCNTLILGAMIYSTIDENSLDWDMAGVTVVSAILPILLLLPVVRKFYWRSGAPAQPLAQRTESIQ